MTATATSRTTTSMRLIGRIFLLGLFAFTCVQAQDITKGSIAGIVRDASGAVVPGASVKLSSPYGDHDTTTNAAGEYGFLNIVIGPGYKITVDKAGFAPSIADNLTVGMNQQITHDFSLAVGSTATTVSVVEVANAIDLSSTAIGGNFDDTLLKNVPVGRNISAVMAMAPGVSDSVGAGAANPSINGASGLENEYVINGADTTDPGFGGFGTYSRVYGPLGNGINFDFVQEVQVQTGGFEAQYGEALGGIVNVVTKSGTNDFHGDVYGYFQPAGFEAHRTDANPLLTSKFDYLVHQASTDYGGDAGGRILKDKLFYYGGINPLLNSNYKEADPFYANYALGVINRKITTYDYTGKIDYNLGSKHQFEGSVFGDPSHTGMTFNQPVSSVPAVNPDGSKNPIDTSLESKLNYGTRTWTARYNGTFTPNWAVTVNYSNYYNSFTDTPLQNGYQITDNTAVQAGTGGAVTYGGVGFLEASEAKVNQMAVSSTHIFHLLGGHSVTYGYQFTDDVYNDIYDVLRRAFRAAQPAGIGRRRRQDDLWRGVHARIRIGLSGFAHRADFDARQLLQPYRCHRYAVPGRLHPGLLDVRPVHHQAGPALRAAKPDRQSESHYDLTHNWAPRIGFVVDPFNDRKTKIYATWGRFFEKVPLDIAVRALSVETQHHRSALRGSRPGPAAEFVAQQLHSGRQHRIPGRRGEHRADRSGDRRTVSG